MSLDGNCGKSDQTNLIFLHDAACWCGLGMLGQHQLSPPPAAIITARRRGRLATNRCRRSTEISVHLSSRAWWSSVTKILVRVAHTGDCMAQFIPNMLYGCCSVATLQAAPSWWRCPAEGNQGLSKQGGVWHYRLDSGSYPRNGAWQMALRCFVKCPCSAHWRGICQVSTRGGLAPLWKAPHTCTEPPTAWTL